MIDRLMILLDRLVAAYERYVVAQELMARSLAGGLSKVVEVAPTVDPVSPAEKEAILSAPAPVDPPPTPTPEALDRERILNRLRELGVKYKATARTESLAKLLKTAEAEASIKPAHPVAPLVPILADDFGIKEEIIVVPPESVTVPVAPPVEPAQPFHSPMVITIEQIRAELVQLATVKGRDVALNVLKTAGKKDKLSDVERSCYPAIMAAVKEAF